MVLSKPHHRFRVCDRPVTAWRIVTCPIDTSAYLRSIPAFAVHGRYDLVCPVKNLDDLCHAWPELDAVIVPDAGHSSHEPGITRELVAATARIADTGSPVR